MFWIFFQNLKTFLKHFIIKQRKFKLWKVKFREREKNNKNYTGSIK